MRIACVLDVDYEDSEFKEPYDAFRKAGHQVTIVGLKSGKELKGKQGMVTTRAEAGLAQVSRAQLPWRARRRRSRAHRRVFGAFGLSAREELACGCHVQVGVDADEEGVA